MRAAEDWGSPSRAKPTGLQIEPLKAEFGDPSRRRTDGNPRDNYAHNNYDPIEEIREALFVR